MFSEEVPEVALSSVGLRGLTWLASDAGFPVLSFVLAGVAELSVSLGVAVSVAACCSRVCTGEGLWRSSCSEGVARSLKRGCCQVLVDQDVGLQA